MQEYPAEFTQLGVQQVSAAALGTLGGEPLGHVTHVPGPAGSDQGVPRLRGRGEFLHRGHQRIRAFALGEQLPVGLLCGL